jgi:hypothetical protein
MNVSNLLGDNLNPIAASRGGSNLVIMKPVLTVGVFLGEAKSTVGLILSIVINTVVNTVKRVNTATFNSASL